MIIPKRKTTIGREISRWVLIIIVVQSLASSMDNKPW